MRDNVRTRAAGIKILCADFDGTFTDGMVYTDQDGIESVRCSRRDSLGIDMLKRAGIAVHVISRESNPVVAARCAKLKIPCNQGIIRGEGKAEIVRRIAHEAQVDLSEVAYIGDDVNDLAALAIVGLAVTVADGHPRVTKLAHFVTKGRGGEHAVRELCELILTTQGHPIES